MRMLKWISVKLELSFIDHVWHFQAISEFSRHHNLTDSWKQVILNIKLASIHNVITKTTFGESEKGLCEP